MGFKRWSSAPNGHAVHGSIDGDQSLCLLPQAQGKLKPLHKDPGVLSEEEQSDPGYPVLSAWKQRGFFARERGSGVVTKQRIFNKF